MTDTKGKTEQATKGDEKDQGKTNPDSGATQSPAPSTKKAASKKAASKKAASKKAASKKDDKPKGKRKGIRVTSLREGFRRGGHQFFLKPTDLALEDLTDEQLEQIKEEPMLLVESCTVGGTTDAEDGDDGDDE